MTVETATPATGVSRKRVNNWIGNSLSIAIPAFSLAHLMANFSVLGAITWGVMAIASAATLLLWNGGE